METKRSAFRSRLNPLHAATAHAHHSPEHNDGGGIASASPLIPPQQAAAPEEDAKKQQLLSTAVVLDPLRRIIRRKKDPIRSRDTNDPIDRAARKRRGNGCGDCCSVFSRILPTFTKYEAVNMFWIEKGGILLDYLQFLAFLWIWPFPWPEDWIVWTQWTRIFLLDFAAWRRSESSSSDPLLGSRLECNITITEIINGTEETTTNIISTTSLLKSKEYCDNCPDVECEVIPMYLLIWVALPIILLLLFIVRARFAPRRLKLERILLSLAQFLFLPLALVAMKYGWCGNDGAVDTFTCSPTSITDGDNRAFIVGGFGLFVLLLFPSFMSWFIHEKMIFSRPNEHEKHVRAIETQYALNLDNAWFRHRYYLFSSFRRRWVYYKPIMMYQKLLVVLALCFGLHYDETIATAGLAALIGIPLVLMFWMLPYRMNTSTFIAEFAGWTIVVSAMLGLMKVLGVESPLLTADVLPILLVAFNGFAIGFVLIGSGIWCAAGNDWPVSRRTTEQVVSGYTHFIEAYQEGKRVLLQNEVRLPEFVECHVLGEKIAIVHDCLQQAKLEEHPFEHSLSLLLDEMISFYNTNRPQTLLPNVCLETILGEFRKSMDQKKKELILIPRRKRSILLKLFALRAFAGHRNFYYKTVKQGDSAQTPGETPAEPVDLEKGEGGHGNAGAFSPESLRHRNSARIDVRPAPETVLQTKSFGDFVVDPGDGPPGVPSSRPGLEKTVTPTNLHKHGKHPLVPMLTGDSDSNAPEQENSMTDAVELRSFPRRDVDTEGAVERGRIAGAGPVPPPHFNNAQNGGPSRPVAMVNGARINGAGSAAVAVVEADKGADVDVAGDLDDDELVMLSMEGLIARKKALNSELKQFEKAFVDKHGRKPKKADIRHDPRLTALYGELIKVRQVITEKEAMQNPVESLGRFGGVE